jgi:hypothetical protein
MQYDDDYGHIYFLAWLTEPTYRKQQCNIRFKLGAGEKGVQVDLSNEEYNSLRAKVAVQA